MSQASNSSPLRKYIRATDTPYTLDTIEELVEGWKDNVDQYGIPHTFVEDEQSIEELRPTSTTWKKKSKMYMR